MVQDRRFADGRSKLCRPWRGQIECFARSSDGALAHALWDGARWQWSILDGQTMGSPKCLIDEFPVIDYCIGGLDGHLHHTIAANGDWDHRWDGLGGVYLGPAYCPRWARGQLNCFVEGADHHLWHTWAVIERWAGGWEGLGGALRGPPSCVSRADQLVDCLVQTKGGGTAHIGWDGEKWKDWDNLDASDAGGAPACIRLDPSSVGCYFLDSKGLLGSTRFSTSKAI